MRRTAISLFPSRHKTPFSYSVKRMANSPALSLPKAWRRPAVVAAGLALLEPAPHWAEVLELVALADAVPAVEPLAAEPAVQAVAVPVAAAFPVAIISHKALAGAVVKAAERRQRRPTCRIPRSDLPSRMVISTSATGTR